jgi:hypothetical protein
MAETTNDTPYHLEAIQALNAVCGTEHFTNHFAYEISQCHEVLLKFIARDDSSPQQTARVLVLRYLDRLLIRAVRLINEEADVMAQIVRNLIELAFVSEHISSGIEEATAFLNEADLDAADLAERIRKANPEAIDYGLATKGDRVATKRSNPDEELLWKTCCKFVHPTSFILQHPEETISNARYKEMFAVKVLEYGWGIVTTFHQINWT